MIDATAGQRRRWAARLGRLRVGPLLGLLFLIGPLSDLAGGGLPAGRVAAVSIVVAAFVAVYLALFPPVRLLARMGPPAIGGALALLAALAGLALLLGAPGSFVLLFVYVVAAAALALPALAAVAVTAAAAAGIAVGLLLAGVDGSSVAAYALTILGVGAILTALGSALRANEELRGARERLARLAVTEERLRIGRDLHDLLGHSLSLIALKSELAAKLVERDPQRARAELGDVQEVSRQALTEVRGAVRGYRRLAFEDALEGARATLAAAGIACEFDSPVPELRADVESVLAWGVREATTNVVRHSGARSCAISLTTGPEEVSLQIDDDGSRGGARTAADGAGLAGLGERVRSLDGTLAAARRPGGGFRVRLTVPLEAA